MKIVLLKGNLQYMLICTVYHCFPPSPHPPIKHAHTTCTDEDVEGVEPARKSSNSAPAEDKEPVHLHVSEDDSGTATVLVMLSVLRLLFHSDGIYAVVVMVIVVTVLSCP